jgi:chromosome segregation ATPase
MGWVNRELLVAHHRARRHAEQLVEVLRGIARPVAPRLTGVDEVARLARLLWHAERETVGFRRQSEASAARALTAEQEAEGWRARAADAEAKLTVAESRLNDAENRLGDVEQQLNDVHRLLSTRRVQAGLVLGRLVDRGRGKR